VMTMKPEREIFELTLRRLGLRAEECLFIDDSLKNVEAAAAMDFQIIHFQNPHQLEGELIRRALL
jgi:HAD superfamily hydrolase (TIGR01509 family)